MMVSAPNLAFRHTAPRGTPPGPARPRNCHDRVVCSLRPRLGNTEITPGCPGQRIRKKETGQELVVEREQFAGKKIFRLVSVTVAGRGKKEEEAGSLAISAAAAASRLAAKPLMCLVYE